MFKSGLGACLLATILFAGYADAGKLKNNREPVGWTTHLNDLGINGTLDHLAEPRKWRMGQVSSFDRSGGSADDQGSEREFEGGKVLADLEGPGSITRIWTRNPVGILHIYVDNIESPVIIAPFAELFTGKLPLYSPGVDMFAPPLVGEAGGGYYSYVPIPYKERCRIVVDTDDAAVSYQINYAQFAPGTEIESFRAALTKDDTRYFLNWREEWESSFFRYSDRDTERIHHSRHNYYGHNNALILPMNGPGVITELEFLVESADQVVLDNTWLSISFDRQETPGVLVPLGDFFGTGNPEGADFTSVVLGRDGTRMWCRFPMPFKEFAEVRLITLSDQVIDLEYFVTWREGPVDDQRYFVARYNSDKTKEGTSYTVADINGTGHFVGATIAASGADSLEFLNGDDTLTIDGEADSAFHGTGTDDYFNAGWYFATGPFSSPVSSASHKAATAPTGFAATRSLITDPVPFSSSLTFELEHGDMNNAPGVNYTSVAYWYQAAAEAPLFKNSELKAVKELLD